MKQIGLLVFLLAHSLALAEHGSSGTSFWSGWDDLYEGFMAPFTYAGPLPTYRSRPTEPPRDPNINPYDIAPERSEPVHQSGAEQNANATAGVGMITAGIISEQVWEGQDFQDFCHPTSPVLTNALRRTGVNARRMARRITGRVRIPISPSFASGAAAIASVTGEPIIQGEGEQYHRLGLDYAECYRTGLPPPQGLGASAAHYLTSETVRERCAYLYQSLTGRSLEGASNLDLVRLENWHEWSHRAYDQFGALGGLLHSYNWPRPPQTNDPVSPGLSEPLNSITQSPFYGVGGF